MHAGLNSDSVSESVFWCASRHKDLLNHCFFQFTLSICNSAKQSSYTLKYEVN